MIRELFGGIGIPAGVVLSVRSVANVLYRASAKRDALPDKKCIPASIRS
jgi:hypothetical protein